MKWGILFAMILALVGCDDRHSPSPDPLQPDAPLPDLAQPDAPLPDLSQPDAPLPDLSQPDAPLPDLAQPDAGSVPGTWVTIPKGTFMMGSPMSEPCRFGNEDQHQVTLTHPFEIQTTEVTQGQFKALTGYNPSFHSACGNTCPVEMVSWSEAVAFCNTLSNIAGMTPCYTCFLSGKYVTCQDAAGYGGQKIYDCPGYRLPTEAEWEYAYRAGAKTAYYNGVKSPNDCNSCKTDANADKIGWYCANAGGKPHPVASKQKNPWGLYDLAGNVWEWCHDHYQNNLGSSAVSDPCGAIVGLGHVHRGGAWQSLAGAMRAASRAISYSPSQISSRTGFRCVRTMSNPVADASVDAPADASVVDAGTTPGQG